MHVQFADATENHSTVHKLPYRHQHILANMKIVDTVLPCRD
jgi:hypothetical protein